MSAKRLSREEAEAWVADYRSRSPQAPTNLELLQVAWFLHADKPNHPLVQWARFQAQTEGK